MTNTLTLLGTGYATATNCYNTCFLLRDEEQLLLVDGGGGNTILSQLQKVSVPITSIHHMFLTHAHTDHVLEILKNDIRDTLGPDTIANIVPSSAEVLLDDIEDSTRRRLLEHSKTVYKSYKTRYLEEVERNKELQKRLEIVERELARYIN